MPPVPPFYCLRVYIKKKDKIWRYSVEVFMFTSQVCILFDILISALIPLWCLYFFTKTTIPRSLCRISLNKWLRKLSSFHLVPLSVILSLPQHSPKAYTNPKDYHSHKGYHILEEQPRSKVYLLSLKVSPMPSWAWTIWKCKYL